MTVIAGAVRLGGDGRDDGRLVRRMLARMSTAPIHVVASENAHLGIAGAPVFVHQSGLITTWDGRLDAPRPSDRHDADVAAEVLAGNPEHLVDLIGDFAVASWWPGERRLLLARDALGMRPLYYAQSSDVFWWASTLAGLLSTEWLPRDLNEGYFAEYLATAPVTLSESPVIGAHRVPLAHRLDLVNGHARLRRYWTPAVTGERVLSLEDAEAQCASLLYTAVTDRLRAARSCAFQLSGGLDSSSVVAVARQSGITRPATYSMVFPAWPSADESTYIAAAETHLACHGTRVAHPSVAPVGLDVFASAVHAGDLPDMATGEFMQAPMLARAAADGHDVVLSGLGGDDWLTGSIFQAADLLRAGRPIAAWQFARQYRSVPWLDPGATTFLRTAAVSLLPESFKNWARGRQRGPSWPWLTSDLVRRVDLATRLRDAFERIPPMSSLVVRESLVRLGSGDSAHAREAHHRMARHAGLELRHPFLDRRVVEFLIGLPDHLRFRDGQHRFLLRRVMKDLLPPVIAQRLDKPNLDDVLLDGLRVADPPRVLHERLEVVERGWVNPAELHTLWPRAQRALREPWRNDDATLLSLWQVLGAEAAARALSSRDRSCP
jgi:asparagine synthase (glutamine-hydrolysing)